VVLQRAHRSGRNRPRPAWLCAAGERGNHLAPAAGWSGARSLALDRHEQVRTGAVAGSAGARGASQVGGLRSSEAPAAQGCADPSLRQVQTSANRALRVGPAYSRPPGATGRAGGACSSRGRRAEQPGSGRPLRAELQHHLEVIVPRCLITPANDRGRTSNASGSGGYRWRGTAAASDCLDGISPRTPGGERAGELAERNASRRGPGRGDWPWPRIAAARREQRCRLGGRSSRYRSNRCRFSSSASASGTSRVS